jgi:hypothetical protein
MHDAKDWHHSEAKNSNQNGSQFTEELFVASPPSWAYEYRQFKESHHKKWGKGFVFGVPDSIDEINHWKENQNNNYLTCE